MGSKKDRPTHLEWAEIRKLARSGGSSSELLPADASTLDKTKYHLCALLLIYKRQNGLTQRELAKKLGVVESRVSEVLHYRIQKLTLDRLVKYHVILNPKFELKVA